MTKIRKAQKDGDGRNQKRTRNCIEKGITMKIKKINKEREKETQKAFNKERDNVYAINLVNIK